MQVSCIYNCIAVFWIVTYHNLQMQLSRTCHIFVQWVPLLHRILRPTEKCDPRGRCWIMCNSRSRHPPSRNFRRVWVDVSVCSGSACGWMSGACGWMSAARLSCWMVVISSRSKMRRWTRQCRWTSPGFLESIGSVASFLNSPPAWAAPPATRPRKNGWRWDEIVIYIRDYLI